MTRPHRTRAGPQSADLERRLEAAVLDRALTWTALAAAGWCLVWSGTVPAPSGPGQVLAGALALTALGELAIAVQLGRWGVSPGMAARGLRLVSEGGRSLGMPSALARSAILTMALLPTLGLGAAALSWSALTDPARRRRPWHDRWTGAVAIDAHAAPGATHDPEQRDPSGLVNLTARSLAPGPAWRVRFDGAPEIRVEGPGLIGRDPEARPGERVQHLVPLADPAVSKTHLRFDPEPDGTLVLLDRGSTNGSTLVRAGVVLGLEPGRPTALADGDVVRLGQRRMAVHRET